MTETSYGTFERKPEHGHVFTPSECEEKIRECQTALEQIKTQRNELLDGGNPAKAKALDDARTGYRTRLLFFSNKLAAITHTKRPHDLRA